MESHGLVLNLILLLLPVLLLLEFLLLCGLAWVISGVGVLVGDIKEMVKLFVLVGPFLAPIFYSSNQLPGWAAKLLHFNPFTLLINCFRDCLLHGRMEHPWSWVLLGPVCLAIFWAGYRIFNRLKPGLGDQL